MPITATEARKLISKVKKKDAQAIRDLEELWKNEDDRKTLIKNAISTNSSPFFSCLPKINLSIPECDHNLFEGKTIFPALAEALEKVGVTVEASRFIGLPDDEYVATISGSQKISYRNEVFFRHRLNQQPKLISIPDLGPDAFLRIHTLVLAYGSEDQKNQYRESLRKLQPQSREPLSFLEKGARISFGIDTLERRENEIQPKLSLTDTEAHFIIESALSEILRLNSASAKAESYSPTGVFESVLRDIFVRNYAIQQLISIVSYAVPMETKRDEQTLKQYLFEHSGIGYALFEVAWEKYRDDEPDQSLLQSLKKIYAQARSKGEIDASTSDVEMDTATTNPDTEPSEPDVDILGDTDTKRQAETEAISSDAAPRVKSPRPTSKRKPSEWTASYKEGTVVLLNTRTGETRPASSSSALPEPDTAPSENPTRIKPSEWTASYKEGAVVLLNIRTGETRPASLSSALPEPDTTPSENPTRIKPSEWTAFYEEGNENKISSTRATEPGVDISGTDMERQAETKAISSDTARGEKRPASRRNDDEISDTEPETEPANLPPAGEQSPDFDDPTISLRSNHRERVTRRRTGSVHYK